jgi:hypothetical protein
MKLILFSNLVSTLRSQFGNEIGAWERDQIVLFDNSLAQKSVVEPNGKLRVITKD